MSEDENICRTLAGCSQVQNVRIPSLNMHLRFLAKKAISCSHLAAAPPCGAIVALNCWWQQEPPSAVRSSQFRRGGLVPSTEQTDSRPIGRMELGNLGPSCRMPDEKSRRRSEQPLLATSVSANRARTGGVLLKLAPHGLELLFRFTVPGPARMIGAASSSFVKSFLRKRWMPGHQRVYSRLLRCPGMTVT